MPSSHNGRHWGYHPDTGGFGARPPLAVVSVGWMQREKSGTSQSQEHGTIQELNLMYALIYLDEEIVFSQMPEEHLIRL